MSSTEAPLLRVSPQTKAQVRLGATLLSCTQGEFVERAVAEFLESHAEDFSERLDRAREALRGDEHAVAAYLLGE